MTKKKGTWQRSFKNNPIEFYECQDLIFTNWKKTSREISKLLADEHNIQISQMTIHTWKKRMDIECSKLLGQNKDYINKLHELELHTTTNLVLVQREINELISKLKGDAELAIDDKDKVESYRMLISLFNTSLNKIAVAMKARGEGAQKIEISKTEEINVNYNDSIQDQILRWAEERGCVVNTDTGEVTLMAPELIDIIKKRKKKKVST